MFAKFILSILVSLSLCAGENPYPYDSYRFNPPPSQPPREIDSDLFPLTEREKILIQHVKDCIFSAENQTSPLSQEVLQVPGMSSAKTRHLLNNLCKMPQTVYLEIGVWMGSTFTAALYGNGEWVVDAIAIDNWAEFGGPKEDFERHCKQFLSGINYRVCSTDCFSLDKKVVFSKPVNIYFYDGNHSTESQESAFTYLNDAFDDVFIAMVDDWNWAEVRKGTESAFQKLGYHVLYEQALSSRHSGDTEQWWNGLYICVIRK